MIHIVLLVKQKKIRMKIKIKNKAYSIIDIGELSDLSDYTYHISNSRISVQGKVFIKEILGTTSCEISFNHMKPNTSMPFIHKHMENEEVYIIIKGCGQMLLNDKIFDIKEGTTVRVSPETERTIRNNSDNDLIFIVIQGKMNSIKSKQIEDGYSIEKQPEWK